MKIDYTNKLSLDYQKQWGDMQYFIPSLLSDNNIDLKSVTLHKEVNHPLSSQASCLNVLGYLNRFPGDIIPFFNYFSMNINEVIPFPTGVDVDGEVYNDKGPIIFEWIGPKRSPIHERSGSRGKLRTSIDAFLLAKINNKVTQIFVEWKFTESYNSVGYTHKFTGIQGNERLRRYSSVIATLRKENDIPCNFSGNFGLYDLGYEPYYQLLRMTLLAKMTTKRLRLNDLPIEDYMLLHLVHSGNDSLKHLNENHVEFSPGLKRFIGREMHDVWKNEILTPTESRHFCYGYWNNAIRELSDTPDKNYLVTRYA